MNFYLKIQTNWLIFLKIIILSDSIDSVEPFLIIYPPYLDHFQLSMNDFKFSIPGCYKNVRRPIDSTPSTNRYDLHHWSVLTHRQSSSCLLAKFLMKDLNSLPDYPVGYSSVSNIFEVSNREVYKSKFVSLFLIFMLCQF